MSFAIIRNAATTSLAATQVQIAIASSNIANADTAGYTRKSSTQSTTVTNGVGTGVTLTAVSGVIDKYLLKDLVTAKAALGAATVGGDYADRLQSLFGTVGDSSTGGTSIANGIASIESALSALAGTPESETLKAQAIDAFDAFATQLRELSSGIQTLRANADGEIATAVDTVNDALHAIDDLNSQIAQAKARGDSTADLEDKRNTAVQTIAEQMNVSYFTTANGEMRIYTASGTPLLDSQVHELSHAAVGAVASNTVFDPILVDGQDITAQITSGRIGALIDQRDTDLVAAQSELDNLAARFIDAVNAQYSQGTSVPPPTVLTGTRTVSATDAFSGSGTVRFAAVGADGTLQSYQDLDLPDYATVGDLVDAINSISGLSAQIDSSGHLVINASSGVAITDVSASSVGAGQTLTSYFGLNNLLSGTDAASMSVRKDILATPGLLATAKLDASASPAIGSVVLNAGSADQTRALVSVLTGSKSFPAAGGLAATSTSFADYAATIVSTAVSAASKAASTLSTRETAYQTLADRMSSQTGVNLDEETARINALQQQYSTAAQLLTVLNAMFDALMQTAQSA
jgi:flagellar hook-associated protein 1